MKVLLLTLTICALAAANNNPKIPVDAGFGRPSFVEPEKLLEMALYPPLLKLGVNDVDVDDVHNEPGTFEMEMYSTKELGDDFKTTLTKIFNTDLGLSDVTVKDSPNSWNKYGSLRTSYYVYFNPTMFLDQMKPLAQKVYATTPFSLEDSMWD